MAKKKKRHAKSSDLHNEGDFAERCDPNKNVAEPSDINKKEDNESVACEYCCLSFCSNYSLKRHMQRLHKELLAAESSDLNKKDDKKSLTCEHCNIIFSRSYTLKRHMEKFHKELLTAARPRDVIKKKKGKSVPCEVCNKTFYNQSSMRRHMKQFHEAQPGDLQDGDDSSEPGDLQDGDDSSEPGDLQDGDDSSEPRKVNKNKTGNSVPCEQCNKTFYDPATLKRHIREVHQGRKRVKITLNRTSQVSVELPGSTKLEDRPFHCTTCGNRFYTDFNLRRHIRAIHKPLLTAKPRNKKEENSVPCELCSQTFYDRSTLRRHIRWVHKGEPRPRYKNVQKPMTFPKPFPCQHCDVTFSFQSSLSRHRHTVHKHLPKARRKSRPSVLGKGKCAYCGQGFYNVRCRLLQHQKQCKRRNDYKCDHCGEIFAKKSDYLAHVRSFCPKRTTKYKCLLCNSWEGTDPMTILDHAMKCKKTRNSGYNKCYICDKPFTRKNVAYHIQYELLHSRLFKDILLDFKCESCEISFPTEAVLSLHQELEHPCLLHNVGLEDLDGFTIDPDKRESLMDERKRVRDLDPKELEFKGLMPKNRCHVCLVPFHSRNVRSFHVKSCEVKFGVKKLQQQERRLHPGKDFFPKRKEKPLHVESEPRTSMSQRLLRRFIFDIERNKNIVSRPRYCEKIEREFRIARGLLRKWIPFVLKDEKEAMEFFNKNLYNEDIAVIRVVPKPVPELIDISKEATPAPQVPPPAKIFKCQSCHKVCASEDELIFHMDTATKYFKKKHNALIRKNKPKKGRVVIPAEETDYDNLELWRFNDKLPQYFCDGCGHPFFCRNVRTFHKFTCKGKPKEVPKENSQQLQQEKRFLLKEPRLVLVRCDDLRTRLKSPEGLPEPAGVQEQQEEGAEEPRPPKRPRLGNVEEIKEPTLGLVRWE